MEEEGGGEGGGEEVAYVSLKQFLLRGKKALLKKAQYTKKIAFMAKQVGSTISRVK